MVVLLRGVDLIPRVQVELCVQGVVRTLLGLEGLQPLRLLHPAGQDAAEAEDGGLAQLVRLAAVVVYASGIGKVARVKKT